MLLKRFFLLLALLGLFIPVVFQTLRYFFSQGAPVPVSSVFSSDKTLILDAGHGGEDGGAVSLSGMAESHINLAIVRRMEDILAFYGTVPLLLRRDDVSLHDPSCVTLREKKVSDLKNRVTTINATPNTTLFSIHQNSYPSQKYRGAQVFFAQTEGSKELAERIQGALAKAIQPENQRACKEIPKTVYLMNHILCRGVLVECGFLTNPEEEQLLQTASYQRKLAAVLSSVWLTDGLQVGKNLIQ